MSAAYDIERWSDLFVASAGASAALAGLVFVAVSINLEQVLADAPEYRRARWRRSPCSSGAVMVSLLCLVPQSSTALGVELVAIGGALLVRRPRCLWGIAATRRAGAAGSSAAWTIALLSTVPFLVAG